MESFPDKTNALLLYYHKVVNGFFTRLYKKFTSGVKMVKLC